MWPEEHIEKIWDDKELCAAWERGIASTYEYGDNDATFEDNPYLPGSELAKAFDLGAKEGAEDN